MNTDVIFIIIILTRDVINSPKITQIYCFTNSQNRGQNKGKQQIPKIYCTAKNAITALDIVNPTKDVEGMIPPICFISNVFIPLLSKMIFNKNKIINIFEKLKRTRCLKSINMKVIPTIKKISPKNQAIL